MDRDAALDELLDRQAILDCVLRYARGIDRLDGELVRSAYHHDAVDDHSTGRMDFVGTPQELIDAARGMAALRASQHYLTNHTVELDGDSAHAETYFLSMLLVDLEGRDAIRLGGGRYLDRLERRDGAWRIAERVAVGEWATTLDADAALLVQHHLPRRDGGDLSYARPLRARRP